MKGFLWKTLWNRRKAIWELLVEQVFIGLVLMLCLSSLLDAVRQYRQPGMLDTGNTYLVMFTANLEDALKDHNLYGNALIATQTALRHLETHPSVADYCVSCNLTPYLRSSDFYVTDTVRVDDQKIRFFPKFVLPKALNIFGLRLEEGCWFTGERYLEDGSAPVVVTRQLADAAGWTDAVNRQFVYKGQTYTVIGVVGGVKQHVFEEALASIFFLFPERNIPNGNTEYVVKVKKGHDVDFYAAIHKEFQQSSVRDKAQLVLYSLDEMKEMSMFNTMLSVVAQAVPVLFLFFFAFIGTFGIFWLQSEKRLKEYALRLALGATRKQLLGMVIGESLAVSALASLPAVLLSFFIFDLTWVNVCAVVATVVLMALFSVFSACYPAYKVSKVNPAEALHYE